MNDAMRIVSGGRFSLAFDMEGNIRGLRLGTRDLPIPVPCTTYEIDGNERRVRGVAGGEAVVLDLSEGDASESLTVEPGAEIRFYTRPPQPASYAPTPPGPAPREAGITFYVPADSKIHLAETRSLGRQLDSRMPVGERFRCNLFYNFLLIEGEGFCVRLRSGHERFRNAIAEIARHQETFAVTFRWNEDSACHFALFSSKEEAETNFRREILEAAGVRPLGHPDRGDIGWMRHVRLVITADMMRSNWTATHHFDDVAKLARDLKEAGCPAETLFYLPGWQGAYDSTHPTYRPCPELGGDAAFRRMVETLHECGFRVMIHTTGWGIDPYHPEIDRLEKLVNRNPDGSFIGWQIGRTGSPPRRRLKFRTGRISLASGGRARAFEIDTPCFPDGCEAHVTMGGVRIGGGRMRLTLGRRSIATPAGWFQEHESHDHPFPLWASHGANRIRIEYEGVDEPDWSGAWIEIANCTIPAEPYTSWTWPILQANMDHPEYQALFIGNVAGTVREFGIDAVHVDATGFYAPAGARELLLKLRESLPDTAICAEGVGSFEQLGFWALAQGSTQALLSPTQAVNEQMALHNATGFERNYAWLDVPSPVCLFFQEYCRSYPHLCAANAFVPLGKVCNTFPPRLIPGSAAEQWSVLRDARRLNYIPGLRVNYREFGLDSQTRDAVRELAAKAEV